MRELIKNNQGLIDVNQDTKKSKTTKYVDVKQDGLMEREEKKVLTKDGRQLL